MSWIRSASLLTASAAALAPIAGNGQSTASWTLSPDLRIGANDRGANYEFVRVEHIAPGPGGTVFVSDVRPPTIRAFDARGDHVRTIGRLGSGPGEFRLLRSITVLGDTLWTVDIALRRVTSFTTDGRVVGTEQQSAPLLGVVAGVFTGAAIAAVFPNGEAIGRASFFPGSLLDGGITSAPVLRMTRDGRTRDTIAWTSTKNSQLILQHGRTLLTLAQPFSDAPLAVLGPEAARVFIVDRPVAASANNAAFGVTAMRPSGDTLWTRRYRYLPTSLDAASRDEALSRVISVNDTPIPRDKVRAAMFIPANRTPVSEGVVATDGSLWLRREDGPGDASYTVIGANGDLRATVTVKRNLRIKAVNETHAWAVETGEDDIQSVVRLRIAR